MSQRLKRMRVLLRAQEQMQRNAQRLLSNAATELENLRKKELALLAFMAEEDPIMVNELMHSHAKQIRQVSQRKHDMQGAMATLKAETRKQAALMKAIERMVIQLEAEERHNREKREHLDIIEKTANRRETL